MTDFDPDNVAIRSAATVMLIDDRPDLQVLMMERHAATIFAGGMWVFPGGSVDDSDAIHAIVKDRTDRDASQLMNLEQGGLAYYIAAIRESFEEAGILLARHKDEGHALSFTDPHRAERFEQYRDQVNAGTEDFIDIVRRENLLLDTADMHYIARWITPVGPPRRFDARFFIARTPKGQIPLHDNRETVHSEWMRPSDILQNFADNKMNIMSPTLTMIRALSKFSSTDQVIESARANQSDQRVRVIPQTEDIVLLGDIGYEAASETIESGWIRLRPLS
jgi:8-oxo-dGTP pyrophosphatase MutT (NUDIX family)